MISEFFGIHGQLSLYGGNRGRTLMVSGLLIADSVPGLAAVAAALEDFADGQVHTLTDDWGRSFSNVTYSNEFQPSEEGPKYSNQGWCLPYRAIFHGLT